VSGKRQKRMRVVHILKRAEYYLGETGRNDCIFLIRQLRYLKLTWEYLV
jgi:hypothetical protein